MKTKAKAAGIHFLVSLLFFAPFAFVVFHIWYPSPFLDISGGKKIFAILLAVDLCLGPFLTFVVFNNRKKRRTLLLDLSVIGVVQSAALIYGALTVYEARPVFLVYDYRSFTVVHAADVEQDLLKQKLSELYIPSSQGPQLISLRPPNSSEERLNIMLQSMVGRREAMQTELWQPYSNALEEIRQQCHPLPDLRAKFPDRAAEIDESIRSSGFAENDLCYFPLFSRGVGWSILLNQSTAYPVSFLPLDSF